MSSLSAVTQESTASALSFNLVNEPWIPVLRNRKQTEVSLADAFRCADEIELAVADPLETVALVRQVLLPIYWRSGVAPADERKWAACWAAGRLFVDARDGAVAPSDERLRQYLRRFHSRFDLFGVEPFAQTPMLRTPGDDTRTAAALVLSTPSGNTVPLFGVRTDAEPPTLSPAKAVRAMLALQCWDTAGLKSGAVDDNSASAGKSYGNPVGPLGHFGVVVPLGTTLTRTLLLNTSIAGKGLDRSDIPPWEDACRTGVWTKRPAIGPIDVLTWQSRRVRLIPEYGENGPVVRRVVVTGGDRLAELPIEYEPHALSRVDTMTGRANPRREQLIRQSPGRALWRSLPGLLATEGPAADGVRSSKLLRELASRCKQRIVTQDAVIRLLAVGMAYGTMSAVVEDVASDEMSLPASAFVPDSPVQRAIVAMTVEAERLRRAMVALDSELRAAVAAKPRSHDLGDDVGENFMHQFTPLVTQVVGVLRRHPEAVRPALALWREQADALSHEFAAALIEAASPRAYLGISRPSATANRSYRHNLSTASWRFDRAVAEVLGASKDVSA
ncbi:type I-E CRISPR-associated protein Cse1/CasA [Nocardia colli]|uniref:Type I-E CRISPR-associated protein Cse1/CasA n=1 Tax=Nocardia colli TaxID=2545717 RepID=A0A5N0DXL4_9NOCA|nr:type I-E CRISPR-associated protein Cse1/CasA [Nocardia colli]KAA8881878.1 type I-E CRISPR-associated protein Cse1/CasA [Nocardia colli]